MGITVDPVVFIIDWLKENWDVGGLGFTPTFSSHPYNSGMVLPLISVKEVPTVPVDHLNLGSTYHLYPSPHAINLWDIDKDQIWDMRQEVRRIIFKYQKDPTTTTYPSPGIMQILITEEFPQDNFLVKPYLLSKSIRVMVLHLEINT